MQKSLLLIVSLMILFATSVQAKEVQVKGYTKKDGTKVEAYTKTVKDKSTVEVKGYTKKDGTVVKSYTRKKSDK